MSDLTPFTRASPPHSAPSAAAPARRGDSDGGLPRGDSATGQPPHLPEHEPPPPTEQVAATPAPRLWQATGVAVGTVVALAFILTVNLLPRVYEVQGGDVAPFSIRAPRAASYVSQVRTRAAREQAAAQVAPIVGLDYEGIAQQRRGLSDLLQAINAGRNGQGRPIEQRADAIRQAAGSTLDATASRQVASMDDTRWGFVAAESQRLLGDVLKDRITEDQLDEVSTTLPLRVSPSLSEGDRAIIVSLVSRFIRPNLVVNQRDTDLARQAAQDAISPVVQRYERGEIVVRDGQVIGPGELEALEILGLRNPSMDWRSVGSTVLFAISLVALLAAYIWHFDRPLLFRTRRILLLSLLLIAAAAAAKMVIPGRPAWVYVLPLPAATMLLTTLFEARLAIVFGALLAIVVGWVGGVSLDITAMVLAGGMAGALSVWKKERLHSYVVAAVYVFLAQLAVYVAFFLASRSDEWMPLPVVAFELLVNGVLSALLAVGGTALVGRMFGILTSMQLLELASPTQPLLRRLLTEAPGTYHHSIMVGNLAERAAEVIGGDSLLVRVAAYYHDIGKLERPWAFIENQADLGYNVHDSLTPQESARLISAHVTDGVRLAQKHGLPPRIVEMIPQHHGTRQISFFYQQASERAQEVLDPCLFSYPGPPPRTREAALLMLADSTEAAARAARDHSREAIQDLVYEIVRQRLEEGQFDDCNLTLRDLTAIKLSFVTLLNGIYHPRIAYPPSHSPPEVPSPRAPSHAAA